VKPNFSVTYLLSKSLRQFHQQLMTEAPASPDSQFKRLFGEMGQVSQRRVSVAVDSVRRVFLEASPSTIPHPGIVNLREIDSFLGRDEFAVKRTINKLGAAK
jgi:hypothetical protein